MPSHAQFHILKTIAPLLLVLAVSFPQMGCSNDSGSTAPPHDSSGDADTGTDVGRDTSAGEDDAPDGGADTPTDNGNDADDRDDSGLDGETDGDEDPPEDGADVPGDDGEDEEDNELELDDETRDRLSCPGFTLEPGDCENATIAAFLRSQDSDLDGLTDYQEACVFSSDPCSIDSSGNGVSDLLMAAAGLDPNEPEAEFPADALVGVTQGVGGGQPEPIRYRFETRMPALDVYLLIENANNASDIVPRIKTGFTAMSQSLADMPSVDINFGAGSFSDFPFLPFGSGLDMPFEHMVDITSDPNQVQEGLNELVMMFGGDQAASQAEAIYQVATGAGGEWSLDSESITIPARSCPDEGAIGYPCFRPHAQRVIAMVSRMPWHEDELGEFPYFLDIDPDPANFEASAQALADIRGRFIGISLTQAGDYKGPDTMRAIARRTGSIDGDGEPLVLEPRRFEDIMPDLEAGIRRLVNETPMDVTIEVTEESRLGGAGTGSDSAAVMSVVALEGYRFEAPGGYEERSGSTFTAVAPGTELEYEINLGDVEADDEETQVAVYRLVALGHDVSIFDDRLLFVITPAQGRTVILEQ